MVSRGVVPIRAGCGGAELAAYQLARHLAHRGHDVTLLSDVDDGLGERVDGLVFVSLDSRLQRLSRRLPGGFLAWIVQHLVASLAITSLARKVLRRERFVLVHAHGSLVTRPFTFFAEIPVAYTEQDAPPWLCRPRRWWERLIRRGIYRVFKGGGWRGGARRGGTVPSLRDELVQRWQVPAANVFTIANGTDFDLF